ncbi:B12-binding domain-containing radical SAM protein [bacterium]|nr:MAG: B12-binding domain-containing radical SAM protein [bacterium]
MKLVLLCAEDFSLSVACLSAFLKKNGHEVMVVFDPKQFGKAYADNKYLSRLFSRRALILRRIKEFSPDLVGFSVFTSNYQWALSVAEEIKKGMDVPIIFGGIHATLVPEVVIKEPSVDMVCVGEGERPLLELLQGIKDKNRDYSIKNVWFKDGERVIVNEIRPLTEDLDTLPFPDRESLYAQLPRSYSKYPIMLTSYGCPYRCTYCANNAISRVYKDKGSYLRRRSPASVIAELREIKSRYMPKYILFMDDLFTFNKSWLADFAMSYSRDIRLPYSCLTHARFLDKEICNLLKLSHCNLVLLGLQSGCERIRREVLDRPESNEEYRKAAGFLKEARLKFSLDNILNIPFDTPDTIRESFYFYNELRPDMIHSFNLAYFPNTKIIEHGIRAGVLKEDSRDLINRGLSGNYINIQLDSHGDYRRYALLFTILPLLPGRFAAKIIKDSILKRILLGLPSAVILLVKFILNVRAGTGFIFFNVINNELFYLKALLSGKIKARISRNEVLCSQ